jgi:hypothetical protein
MARTTFALRQLHVDKDQATATYGPIGVVIWHGEVTLSAVTRVKEMGLSALADATHGAVLMGVVEPDSMIPSSEARNASAQVNDVLFARGVRGFAGVFPDQGFAGAWKRGVVTGITMLSRNKSPFRVFQHPREACQWFQELMPEALLDWADAAHAIEQLRREYAELYRAPRGRPS